MLILGSIVLTAILLALDWEIWEPRYRISAPWGHSPTVRSQATQAKRQIPRRSAVGGELVAALAPQALHRNVAPKQGWVDHCSQG
jgi:hypothetical protein